MLDLTSMIVYIVSMICYDLDGAGKCAVCIFYVSQFSARLASHSCIGCDECYSPFERCDYKFTSKHQ